MLNFYLDVDKTYKWIMITPNQNAKELPFSVSEVGHFKAGPNFYTERTGKKEYYILYTISGRGIIKHKGQTLQLEKNTAILIYCEDYHHYATDSSDSWEHVWIHFNGVGAKSYYDIVNDTAIKSVFIEDTADFMKNIKNIMSNPGVNDIKQSMMISLHITNILTAMAMGKYRVKDTKVMLQHKDSMAQVIEYIENNYQNPITLEDFTKVAHLSKYYFLKLFKQFSGMTPYEYLINYRIDMAKKLLRSTENSVGQIAFAVGFLDECNFIRKFKKVVGVTPLHFRKFNY